MVAQPTDYFHALDGRLRIKIPEVQRSPAKAAQVEERFLQLEGIIQAKANPVTGNVLVLYDSRRLGQQQILAVFQDLGFFQQAKAAPIAARASAPAGPGLGESVAMSLAGLLLEIVVHAAFSK